MLWLGSISRVRSHCCHVETFHTQAQSESFSGRSLLSKHMAAKRTGELVCPSARAAPGATLLGIVGPDERVQYIKDRLKIDQMFVEQARRQGSPEQRFRFANSCVESRCLQWVEGKC